MKRVQIEQADAVGAEKLRTKEICCELANHAKNIENNLEGAVKHLKEALIYCDDDVNVSTVF